MQSQESLKGVRKQFAILETETPDGLERVRFAALKLSEGNMEKLHRAVKLAKADWRDLLVAAGFADSVHAHKHWVTPSR
jgi:hypothetical protein